MISRLLAHGGASLQEEPYLCLEVALTALQTQISIPQERNDLSKYFPLEQVVGPWAIPTFIVLSPTYNMSHPMRLCMIDLE